MHERFCNLCGGRLGETARCCGHCGAPASAGKKSFLNSPGFLIVGGTLLAAIVLFTGVRFFAALQSGVFPREGFYLSAGIVVVVVALAFAFGRLWAARAAGFSDARYHRALNESKASGIRQTRAVARPVLLAVCLCTLLVAGAALLIKPASPSAESGDALAAGAQSGDAQNAAVEAQPTATPYVSNSKVKINGIWSSFTDETSGLYTLQRFVYIDDEKVVCGTCAMLDEVETKLNGGTTLGEVTIDGTFYYDVTAVSLMDVRGLSSPYVASAELALSDPTGALAPFTTTFGFGHVLNFKNCTAGDPGDYEYYLYDYGDTTFTFDSAEVESIATLPLPTSSLYGFWIAQDSMDAFSSFEKHNKNDIPFLFFDIDTMYVGLCSSAASIRDVHLATEDIEKTCTILAQYPFTFEDMTYALSDDGYPIPDTCVVVVNLDSMAALDAFMTEGAVFQWEDTTYVYSDGVEWSAPYDD